jgi:hypothetical protein
MFNHEGVGLTSATVLTICKPGNVRVLGVSIDGCVQRTNHAHERLTSLIRGCYATQCEVLRVDSGVCDRTADFGVEYMLTNKMFMTCLPAGLLPFSVTIYHIFLQWSSTMRSSR